MSTVGVTTVVTVSGLMGSKRVTARVDTGAENDSIDLKLASEIGAGPVTGVKKVRSASASRLRSERRPVVHVTLELAGTCLPSEATLADRRDMRYPMIVGRKTLRRAGVTVDPSREEEPKENENEIDPRRIVGTLKLHKRLLKAVGKKRAVTPAILALQHGGAWSYRDDDVSSVAVPLRRLSNGVVREDLYLLLNPEIERVEGTLIRLEKCGLERVRRVAKRPRRLEVRHDGGAIIHVDPGRKRIRVRELDPGILQLEGIPAANLHHELSHLMEDDMGPSVLEFEIE
ncbi:putative ATP-dependent zinc protease [Methanopyrus sp.]